MQFLRHGCTYCKQSTDKGVYRNMKNEISCCDKEKCSMGKWMLSACALVGFGVIAASIAVWLYKKYKKCVAPFSDCENIDCSFEDMCE